MPSPYIYPPEQSYAEQDMAQMVCAMVSDDLSTAKYGPLGLGPPAFAPPLSSIPLASHPPSDTPFNLHPANPRHHHLTVQVPHNQTGLLSAFQPSSTPFANSPGQASPHTRGSAISDALTPRSAHSVLDNSPVSSPHSLTGGHNIWGAPSSVSPSPGRPSPLGCELSHGLGSPPGQMNANGYAEVLGNGVPGQEMFLQAHTFPAVQRFDAGCLGPPGALHFSTFTATATAPASPDGPAAMASTGMKSGLGAVGTLLPRDMDPFAACNSMNAAIQKAVKAYGSTGACEAAQLPAAMFDEPQASGYGAVNHNTHQQHQPPQQLHQMQQQMFPPPQRQQQQHNPQQQMQYNAMTLEGGQLGRVNNMTHPFAPPPQPQLHQQQFGAGLGQLPLPGIGNDHEGPWHMLQSMHLEPHATPVPLPSSPTARAPPVAGPRPPTQPPPPTDAEMAQIISVLMAANPAVMSQVLDQVTNLSNQQMQEQEYKMSQLQIQQPRLPEFHTGAPYCNHSAPLSAFAPVFPRPAQQNGGGMNPLQNSNGLVSARTNDAPIAPSILYGRGSPRHASQHVQPYDGRRGSGSSGSDLVPGAFDDWVGNEMGRASSYGSDQRSSATSFLSANDGNSFSNSQLMQTGSLMGGGGSSYGRQRLSHQQMGSPAGGLGKNSGSFGRHSNDLNGMGMVSGAHGHHNQNGGHGPQHISHAYTSLREMLGHVAEISRTQTGSLAVQRALDLAADQDPLAIAEAVREVAALAPDLSTDAFANYVVQKMLGKVTRRQALTLAISMLGHVVALATDAHGCRVLQRVIEMLIPQTAVAPAPGPVRFPLDKPNPRNHAPSSDKILAHYPNKPNSHLAITANLHVMDEASADEGDVGAAERMDQQRGPDDALGFFTSSELEDMECEQVMGMMAAEMAGQVVALVYDQHGNHVISAMMHLCSDAPYTGALIDELLPVVVRLSRHPYGCRVVQRLVTHCNDMDRRANIVAAVLPFVLLLSADVYANYVVQSLIDPTTPGTAGVPVSPNSRTARIPEAHALAWALLPHLVELSYTKFGSNVVEKVLALPSIPGQDKTLTQSIVASLLRPTGSAPLTKASAMLACRDTNAHINAECNNFRIEGIAGNLPKDLDVYARVPDAVVRIRPDSLLMSEVALKAGPLGHLLIDPFGNYCMQKLLKVCSEQQRMVIFSFIQNNAASFRNNCHGRKFVDQAVHAMSGGYGQRPSPKSFERHH